MNISLCINNIYTQRNNYLFLQSFYTKQRIATAKRISESEHIVCTSSSDIDAVSQWSHCKSHLHLYIHAYTLCFYIYTLIAYW